MVELTPHSYLLLKASHVVSAALSVLAFLASWVLLRTGRKSLFRKPVPHFLIHLNDTLLFTLGISLIWLLDIKVMETPWLQLKLVLVVLYIPLVIAALAERLSQRIKNILFVLVLVTVASIVYLAHFKPALGFHV